MVLDEMLAPNDALILPLSRVNEISWFDALMGFTPVKALLPIPILVALAPLVWWFFRDTWRRLDREAHEYRQQREGAFDPRPAFALLLVAVILTLQEYYGGRSFFGEVWRPLLAELEHDHGWNWIQLKRYDELYGYAWWSGARVLGYVVIPLPLWKLVFRKDSLLDMGFRVRGFLRHAWIYGVCLLFVVPAMFLVASQPDFGSYYPFYKLSSRSWFDFLAWELMYFAQFFALESFFRGWLVGALRKSLGSSAIFAMALPYCMIHYGKPYLEANGAIVAGVVLGSLAMRTRSIYAGFLVHVTVAGLMDWLSLWKQQALPTVFWPLFGPQ